ncbi:hypothetical protein N7528_007467 [Penicillium herquei]|nr:hypothetical protein N7528_007467 [Penicillium herquei]
MKCLDIGIEGSACPMSNTTCICADTALQANLTICAANSCTAKEILSTTNATTSMCNEPIRDRGTVILMMNSFFGAIAIIGTPISH